MNPNLHLHGPEAVTHDRHGIGVLDPRTCLRLLAEEAVGRLGFSAGSLPVIYPVNYVLDGATAYFRSERGEKTEAALHNAVACLEIDRYDRVGHSGWSVLATGRLAIVPPERRVTLEDLPLRPWALTEADILVELPVEIITGRAFGQV